jgi:hypothetical protein
VTTGAVIHYTSNGIDPTVSDPVIASGGTIQVTTGITNKLRAFRADLTASAVARAIFTNKVAPPFFSPLAGAVTNGTLVNISTITPGATIYFTTNGTTPTTGSLVYSTPIAITQGVTLNALGVENGYSNSVILTASYSIAAAAMPVFSPASGLVTNGASITITCATPGSTIFYTLDGSTPTTNSAVYSGPLTANPPFTLTALAVQSAYANNMANAFYSLQKYESYVVTTFAGNTIPGYTNATGTLAAFSTPLSICMDKSGNLYSSDSYNSVIRKISTNGEVTTFAGNGEYGFQDGLSTNAQFTSIYGICIDHEGEMLAAEDACFNWWIRKIDTNGAVTTLVTNSLGCVSLWQAEVDSADNVYVGEGAGILKISPDGTETGFAGNNEGWVGRVGIGIDTNDNIFAATGANIFKITPDGTSEVYAGGVGGYSDGSAALARFQDLRDAFVDRSQNVFVTDGPYIRKISPAGWVSTIAGTGVSGYQNGRGTIAQFNSPDGLCMDTNGNIYIADSNNNCIRKISPDTARIGIADDWQRAHFGYVGIDPNADPDHDGMNNYQEFWAGTDPLDSNSFFAIKSLVVTVGGFAQISWESVAGKTYTVQYSDDAKTWSSLGSSITSDGATTSTSDSTSIQQAQHRIYRVFVNF